MWVQEDDPAPHESDGESGLSSEDDVDIQCEILEKQRDDANQKLSELEEVSNQLLKEINMLEMQFQIERSCRQSAEALAVQVTKENKVLKRKSQMLMPLIPELPENSAAVTFDPEAAVNGDVVDFGEDGKEETPLMESQATIAELQASVDSLLTEKLQLEQKVEELNKDQVQLREQLALEVEEKSALMRKITKDNKTINKIKRVSQLVTEEFTEMSQKLELEQGLRQHAEVFAHQMLVQQEAAQRQSVMLMRGSETGLQLQQALDQISSISAALCDIQRRYQEQVNQGQGDEVDCGFPPDPQSLKTQLERSEEERKTLETQLSEANTTIKQLQEEVKKLQDELNRRREESDQPEGKSAPPAPPPPPPPPPAPPPPPPPQTTITDPLVALRNKIKDRGGKTEAQMTPAVDMRAKAVDEMMERIKNGIVLRPMKRIKDEDSSWKDQRSENRKSAILELKGMLDNMKRQPRRVPSRRGLGRNVGEAELLQVLQRRRRAMGENRDLQDPLPPPQSVPAAGDPPWAGESGGVPVLRRLKLNREMRDSRIRASALIQEN